MRENPRSILAHKFEEFVHEESIAFNLMSMDNPHVENLFRKLKTKISSWPVLINQREVDELTGICKRIPELLNQIHILYFDKNISEISDFYFEGDLFYGEFAIMCLDKNVQVSYRFDLTMDLDGFKVIEANVGSCITFTCGVNSEKAVRQLHSPLCDNATSDNFICRHTTNLYAIFLINEVLKFVNDIEDEINVFIFSNGVSHSDQLSPEISFFNTFLQDELEKRNMKGTAFSGDAEKLTVIDDALYIENTRLHAFISITLVKASNPEIFRAFLNGKVYLHDNIGFIGISADKRNLALLRELALSKKLDPEDAELVLACIPWTVIPSRNKEVNFKGERHNLLELLKKEKDSFVLKPADGAMGINVFIGKFLSEKDWLACLNNHFTSRNYIIQEYIESIHFLAPNSVNMWTPHQIVWCSYGFGETYGGTFARMSGISTVEEGQGVINLGQGTTLCSVFEIKNTKRIYI